MSRGLSGKQTFLDDSGKMPPLRKQTFKQTFKPMLEEEEFTDDLCSQDLRINYLELDRNLLLRWWNTLLAVAAFLDFSVAVLQSFPSVEQSYFFTSIQSSLRSQFQTEVLFSGLWFLDAFIAEHQIRVKTLRERDKARLLVTTRTEYKDEQNEWWKGAEAVYFTSVSIQLLLLPVEFYIHVLTDFFDQTM